VEHLQKNQLKLQIEASYLVILFFELIFELQGEFLLVMITNYFLKPFSAPFPKFELGEF
jgi:hypothetical protein